MWLSKYRPGKPWIIPVALVGIVYGVITAAYAKTYKPALLMD